MDSSTLKTAILMFLGMAGMFLGRIPWVATVIRILTQLVQDEWDAVYELTKKPKVKKVMTAAKKEGVDLANIDWSDASQQLAATMEDIKQQAGGIGDKPLAAGKAQEEAGFRH